MQEALLLNKEVRAYTVLTALVICGLGSCIVTAPKIIHFGIDFPFSNIVFALLTYPIVDCICELWGKKAARQTLWLGLASQLFISAIIFLSIQAPAASFWLQQSAYQAVLGTSGKVVIASLLAFAISQMLDIVVYQRLKDMSGGKFLWLRTNVSTYLGQMLDSFIFVFIVFADSPHKMAILMGSITVKIILSFLMTPVVYLIVMWVNGYLDGRTLAFKVAG